MEAVVNISILLLDILIIAQELSLSALVSSIWWMSRICMFACFF